VRFFRPSRRVLVHSLSRSGDTTRAFDRDPFIKRFVGRSQRGEKPAPFPVRRNNRLGYDEYLELPWSLTWISSRLFWPCSSVRFFHVTTHEHIHSRSHWYIAIHRYIVQGPKILKRGGKPASTPNQGCLNCKPHLSAHHEVVRTLRWGNGVLSNKGNTTKVETVDILKPHPHFTVLGVCGNRSNVPSPSRSLNCALHDNRLTTAQHIYSESLLRTARMPAG